MRESRYLRGIKKNTEQYKLELEEVNKKNETNIRLRDEYVKDDVKIIHICTCGREWNVAPTTVLQGSAKSCGLCHSKSFEQWCLDNDRKDVLDRWDYDLNDLKPCKITHSTNNKYYFKCPRDIHNSELKKISAFTSGQDGSIKCNQCNSFAQWGLDNLGDDFLEKYWDYEKNNELEINPWEISKGSRKNVYIKCQEKDYHKNNNIICSNFIIGYRCSYCAGRKVHPKDSFAQYLIDLYGEYALEKYWDYDKNIINPWEIAKTMNSPKIWIKCQEKYYHGSYDVSCSNFVYNNRCPYCTTRHGKVHPLDSLGTLHPEVFNVWSDKNPYEYTPYANQDVYWKCPINKHEDYPRRISNSNVCNFRCPECQYSKGEESISNYLIHKGFIKIDQDDFEQLIDEDKYSNNYYLPQMKYSNLSGLKGGLLSYDFYLPKYNLLIEFHGEQHERYILGFHESYDDFLKQVEHDKRKCEYALNNNINLLVIWYWDYDKIEEILKREIT